MKASLLHWPARTYSAHLIESILHVELTKARRTHTIILPGLEEVQNATRLPTGVPNWTIRSPSMGDMGEYLRPEASLSEAQIEWRLSTLGGHWVGLLGGEFEMRCIED